MGAARGYGLFFVVAFVLTVAMLMTDTNLRTDFGTMSSGYYFHWDVVLVTAVADLIGAALILVVGTRTVIRIGVLGSGLLSLIFLGDIFTYAQVGFGSAGDFANYLFGVTYYGNDLRYLYDVLLATYLITFISGLLLLARTRTQLPE